MGTANTVLAIGGVGAIGFGAYYMYKKGMFSDMDDWRDGGGNGGDGLPATLKLTLNILDANGNPMKNTDITLWVGADWHDGTTDSSGVVEFTFDATGTDQELSEISKFEVEVAPNTQGEFSKMLDVDSVAEDLIDDGAAERTIQSTQSTLVIEVLKESNDSPVADAGVSVDGESDAGDEISESRDTDGEGIATFVAIPKGTYDVTIITTDDTLEHTLTTPSSETITYKIRTRASTIIHYKPGDGSDFDGDVHISIDGPVTQSKPVGDDLASEFIDIPVGMYSVTVNGTHIKNITRDMKLDGEDKTITTEIPTYDLYFETIAKETGDYLKGVQVELSNESSYGPRYNNIVSTNEDGLATFRGVPTKTSIRIKASIEGEQIYSEQISQSSESDREISIEIEGYCKTGKIKVEVDDPDGSPASGEVGLTDYGVGPGGMDAVSLNSNGVATIKEVPVGTHTVTVEGLGTGIAQKGGDKDVDVEENKTASVKFDTDYFGKEPGKIIVSTDSRVDGTEVYLLRGGDQEGVKTLSGGKVEWDGVRPSMGTTNIHTVLMTAEGTQYSKEFYLHDGETVNIEFELQDVGTGTFTANVKNKDSLETLPNVDVNLSKGDKYDNTKNTNLDGEVTFEDVPAYDGVVATVGSNTECVDTVEKTIDIEKDGEVSETFKMQYTVDDLALTVEARSGGGDNPPIPKFTVKAKYSGGTYQTSGEDGEAVLKAPPGTYDVTVSSSMSVSGQDIFLPQSRTIDLNADMTVQMWLKPTEKEPPTPPKK